MRTTEVASANAMVVWLLGNDQSPASGQCAISMRSQQPRGCWTMVLATSDVAYASTAPAPPTTAVATATSPAPRACQAASSHSRARTITPTSATSSTPGRSAVRAVTAR
ncbi:hypothetical protein D3C74_420590 [compost metagenome]